LVEDGKDLMEEQTGGLSYSFTEKDVREYMELVLRERKRSTVLKKKESNEEANEDNSGNSAGS
jgi:hypothetical protein